MERKSINKMLDDIEDAVSSNPLLEDTVREGLELILSKIKDTEKWKIKK
jgi:hypothetical protein